MLGGLSPRPALHHSGRRSLTDTKATTPKAEARRAQLYPLSAATSAAFRGATHRRANESTRDSRATDRLRQPSPPRSRARRTAGGRTRTQGGGRGLSRPRRPPRFPVAARHFGVRTPPGCTGNGRRPALQRAQDPQRDCQSAASARRLRNSLPRKQLEPRAGPPHATHAPLMKARGPSRARRPGTGRGRENSRPHSPFWPPCAHGPTPTRFFLSGNASCGYCTHGRARAVAGCNPHVL